MPFLPFVYGYPSSSPHAHCTPNKSVPTLHYTHRHGPIYTGPCPKALTKCSPLDVRRLSIKPMCKSAEASGGPEKVENVKRFPPAQFHLAVLSVFIQKRTFYCLKFELFVAPPMKSRKVCSQGICYLFHLCWPCSWHHRLAKDCWVQNGSIHDCVFATFQHWFFFFFFNKHNQKQPVSIFLPLLFTRPVMHLGSPLMQGQSASKL